MKRIIYNEQTGLCIITPVNEEDIHDILKTISKPNKIIEASEIPQNPTEYELTVEGNLVLNKERKKIRELTELDAEYLPILDDLKDDWAAACMDKIENNEKPIEEQYQAKVEEYEVKRKAIEAGEEVEIIPQPVYFCKVCGSKMNPKNETIYKCLKCGWERKI